MPMILWSVENTYLRRNPSSTCWCASAPWGRLTLMRAPRLTGGNLIRWRQRLITVLICQGRLQPLQKVGFVLVNVQFAAHEGMPGAAKFRTSQFPNLARVPGFAGLFIQPANFHPGLAAGF